MSKERQTASDIKLDIWVHRYPFRSETYEVVHPMFRPADTWLPTKEQAAQMLGINLTQDEELVLKVASMDVPKELAFEPEDDGYCRWCGKFSDEHIHADGKLKCSYGALLPVKDDQSRRRTDEAGDHGHPGSDE